MKKATKIAYNPYENEIQFEIALSTEGPWMDLAENSALLQYTNKKVLFAFLENVKYLLLKIKNYL